ncbi:catechol 2,3-dioxygenase-like lactoylglutathione lyase family enzyme [Thermocatellispora tengchongensis]|uniref:Catechol 2,3-dioxygenase-like lactoylglutathione lyase family enzyme n=1 Tax=Thermocatellispora tengchongensis TaxID=1073253 RepID=A0A840PDL8_9ACTN|nr:VOC family protein [Thermocatellispora tengchongensis]MBB5137302.1 catechol 2,3-dioxygenase-like lactoylglutathione lyase family enzyme [Thermocatellispora tengchongensis]
MINLVREVPNLRLTRAFYTEFGLEETSPGRFSTVVGGEQLVLRAGDVPRVVELTIGADSDADLDAIAHRIEGLGIAPARTDAGLAATEPVSGVLVRVVVAARLPKDPPPSAPTSADRTELVHREPIRPLRLGHVAIGCADVEEAKRFFLDGIGMRLSDYVIAGPFMRFETDHHNIVLLPAPMTLLHHTAWKVRDVDEIGYGGTRMIESHPERHAWGLGRHAASANYFWYLKDPAGAFAEYYYSEMDDLADTPYFWDPVPGGEELPVAAWASPATSRPGARRAARRSCSVRTRTSGPRPGRRSRMSTTPTGGGSTTTPARR